MQIGKLATCGSTSGERDCTEADRGKPRARAGFSDVWGEDGSKVQDVVGVEVVLASVGEDVHGNVG